MARKPWVSYNAYINSAKWQEKRRLALAKADFTCVKCKKRRIMGLHVHHKTYKRLGNERLSDLQVLCESCHMLKHTTAKQPAKTKKSKVTPYRKKKTQKPVLEPLSEEERAIFIANAKLSLSGKIRKV